MNGQSEWYIDPGDCTMVLDGPDCNHGNTIARCPTAEDAAQIVCEHNSHAALVAACEGLLDENDTEPHGNCDCAQCVARAAIAAADLAAEKAEPLMGELSEVRCVGPDFANVKANPDRPWLLPPGQTIWHDGKAIAPNDRIRELEADLAEARRKGTHAGH